MLCFVIICFILTYLECGPPVYHSTLPTVRLGLAGRAHVTVTVTAPWARTCSDFVFHHIHRIFNREEIYLLSHSGVTGIVIILIYLILFHVMLHYVILFYLILFISTILLYTMKSHLEHSMVWPDTMSHGMTSMLRCCVRHSLERTLDLMLNFSFLSFLFFIFKNKRNKNTIRDPWWKVKY